MNKIKSFFKGKIFKKILCVGCVLMIVMCSSVVCFAAEGTTPVDKTPKEVASEVFTFLAQQLNFTTILSVIGVTISAALAMVLGWWAIRKVANALMTAFSRGKLRL